MGYFLELIKNNEVVNWLVPDIEDVIKKSSPRNSDIKKLHDIGVNMVANTVDKVTHNFISRDKVKWYSHYALFGTEILLLKSLISLATPIPVLPLIGVHWVGGIVGAIMQGNSGCKWQVELADTSRIGSIVTLTVLGTVCCAGMGWGMNLFANILPAIAPVAKAAGLIATTGVMSHAMCRVERIVGGVLKDGLKSAIDTIKEIFKEDKQYLQGEKKESCCDKKQNKKIEEKAEENIKKPLYKDSPSCCSKHINKQKLPEDGHVQKFDSERKVKSVTFSNEVSLFR